MKEMVTNSQKTPIDKSQDLPQLSDGDLFASELLKSMKILSTDEKRRQEIAKMLV